jgi:hypothetical protein
MSLYYCFLCNYKTEIKTHFKRHTETKKHKRSEEFNKTSDGKINLNLPHFTSFYLNLPHKKSQNSQNSDSNNVCVYCNHNITQKNVKRHLRYYCLNIPVDKRNQILNKYFNHKKTKTDILQIHPTDLNEITNGIDNGDIEMNNNKKQINSFLNNTNNTNNTTNTTNNINLINNGNIMNQQHITNNNLTIKINPFGEEDLTFLTKKEKLKILNKCYMGVPELIKQIHSHNDNHNFFIPNLNKKVIAFLNINNEIEYDDYNNVCSKLVEKNIQLLDELFDEFGTMCKKTINSRLKKVIEDNNLGDLSNKYIEDIKYYLMNISKKNKTDINNYLDELENKMKTQKKYIPRKNIQIKM